MGKKKVKISSILLYAVLIFWLLITVIPILWVFENSFKPSEEKMCIRDSGRRRSGRSRSRQAGGGDGDEGSAF